MNKTTPQRKSSVPRHMRQSKRKITTKPAKKLNKRTKQTNQQQTPLQQQQFAQFSALPPNPAMQRNMNRPSTSLYRDCLRLIDYMAGKSRKSDRLREIIRGEFEKNRNETDQEKIEQLKGCAVQGLSNYLTIESLARAGNKFMQPNIQQDQSLFDRRRNLQQSSNNLSLEELQQIEAEGEQEYRGVSIGGDFASQGVDIGHIPKDDKPQFVKDLVSDKTNV